MASNTKGIGYFTAENIVAVLRALPETDGTYGEVTNHAREYGGDVSQHTPTNRPKRKVFEHPFEIPTREQKPKRNRRHERKEAGICRDCPNNTVPGRVRCSTCAERHRVARRRNSETRRVAQCTNIHPPTPSSSEIPVQTALPITGAAEREATPPQRIKPTAIRPRPRSRRRVNKDLQRPMPGLPGSGDEGKT